jgi:hypothetical protein
MTTTTTTTSFTQGVKAIKMTAEQVKADSKREYNPQAWERNVDSYSKYKDVEFYKVSKDSRHSYDRFYVVYTLPEGLRLLGDFGYSSMLHNGGFYQAFISVMDMDIDENGDIVSCKMLEPNNVYIKIRKIRFSDGQEGVIDTTKTARNFMTEHSQKYGQIWTKEYFTS